MNYEEYFSGITLDRLKEALEQIEVAKADPETFIDKLHNLDRDVADLFVIRGMMYVCLELEFGLQGDDIWSACDLYTQVAKASNELWDTDPAPEGFQYYN